MDCIGLPWTIVLLILLLCLLLYELFWILLDYDQADTASARKMKRPADGPFHFYVATHNSYGTVRIPGSAVEVSIWGG